jgi:hypothetical protein
MLANGANALANGEPEHQDEIDQDADDHPVSSELTRSATPVPRLLTPVQVAVAPGSARSARPRGRARRRKMFSVFGHRGRRRSRVLL